MRLLSRLKRRSRREKSLLQKEKGFFSIEMIIVLVVLLSILAAAAGRIAQLFTASSSTSAASNIISLETSVRSLKTSGGYGSQELSQTMITMGSVPSGLTVSGNQITNEWGGVVAIQPSSSGVGFSIHYPAVPKEVAAKLAVQLLSSGNFNAIEVNGTKFVPPGSLADVSAALQGASSAVTMVFYVDDVSSAM